MSYLISDLTTAAHFAWQRVNTLADLYEKKGSTLRYDGTYPSFAELEPLRTQMLEAVEEAAKIDEQIKAAWVDAYSPAPDAYLEAAYEQRFEDPGDFS